MAKPAPLLFAAFSFSCLGDGLRLAALPLLVASRTGSGARLGLVSSLEYLAAVLVALVAGAAADSLDRRKLLVGAELGLALVVGSVGLSEMLGGPTVSLLYVAAPLLGGLTMLSNLAFNAGLPRLVGLSGVGRATSLLVAARWVGQVVGPLVMGFAFARFEGRGVAVALAFDALSFAAVSSFFGMVRVQLGPGAEGAKVARVAAREALRFVRQERGILRVLVFLSLQNALMLPLLGAMTFFITRHCALSAEDVGVAFSCFAVGAVPGALGASRLGPRHLRWGLMSANFACGVAIALASLARALGPAALFGCITFAGAAYAFCVSLAHGVRVSLTPDGIRGRVGSLGALLTDALTPVGLVGIGFMVDAVDARAAVLAIGLGAAALSALWILPWRREEAAA